MRGPQPNVLEPDAIRIRSGRGHELRLNATSGKTELNVDARINAVVHHPLVGRKVQRPILRPVANKIVDAGRLWIFTLGFGRVAGPQELQPESRSRDAEPNASLLKR